MPYEFYKVMHLTSIFLIFLSLGGAGWVQLQNPGEKKYPGRKWIFIAHGVGGLLALVAGFGLLARIGASAGSTWVIGKLIIWLLLGGMIGAIHRMPKLASKLILVSAILGFTASFLAVYKI